MRRAQRGGFIPAVIALLLLTAVITVTPATGHVNDSAKHLWQKHIKPKLAKTGTINSSGNPVDWTRLKNVPNRIAAGGPVVINGFNDGPEQIPGTSSPQEMFSVTIGAGSWVALAKLYLRSNESGPGGQGVTCELSSGEAGDRTVVNLAAFESKHISLQIVTTVGDRTPVALSCSDGGTDIEVNWVKLTAFTVASKTDVSL